MEGKYKQFFFDLRGRLLAGIIDYDTAKMEARSVIDEMNDEGRRIAKKYGKRFKSFSFANLVR